MYWVRIVWDDISLFSKSCKPTPKMAGMGCVCTGILGKLINRPVEQVYWTPVFATELCFVTLFVGGLYLKYKIFLDKWLNG